MVKCGVDKSCKVLAQRRVGTRGVAMPLTVPSMGVLMRYDGGAEDLQELLRKALCDDDDAYIPGIWKGLW